MRQALTSKPAAILTEIWCRLRCRRLLYLQEARGQARRRRRVRTAQPKAAYGLCFLSQLDAHVPSRPDAGDDSELGPPWRGLALAVEADTKRARNDWLIRTVSCFPKSTATVFVSSCRRSGRRAGYLLRMQRHFSRSKRSSMYFSLAPLH